MNVNIQGVVCFASAGNVDVDSDDVVKGTNDLLRYFSYQKDVKLSNQKVNSIINAIGVNL